MIIEDNLKLAPLVLNTSDASKSTQASADALAIANAVKTEVENERIGNNVYPQIHWDFYHSHQQKYFVKRKNEDVEQFAERKKNGKTVNYVRFITDLDTRFLYGRPNKIGRQFGGDKKTEARLREINKLININNFQMESKRNASLYGEQGVRLIPVDKRTGSQVEINTKIDENVYPHPVPLDARTSFFLLNPYGKVVAVTLVWEYTDYTQQSKKVKVTELYTDDSRWTWHDDALHSAELNKYTLRDEFVLQKNNPQRIDNIQDVLILQTAFNECLTDNSYFFARHGRPQLVSEVDLSNVINKGDTVWEIKGDDMETKKVLDKLGFLVWDGKMEASMAHLEGLEAKIFKVSSTAAISTGDLKGIGNLRSGAALITAHSPSIQKAKEQVIIWEENEDILSNAIVAFDALIHKTSVEQRFPKYEFVVNFPTTSGVPGEELMNTEIQQASINSHFVSIADVVRQNNPSWTDEQIKEYRQVLIKDSDEITDSKRAFVTETKEPANGTSSSAKKSKEQSKPKT